MTGKHAAAQCETCGAALAAPAPGTPGRRPRYCSMGCRVKAYRARKAQA